MMHEPDLRWVQRLSNFNKAFGKLEEAIRKIETDYQVDADGNIGDDAFLDDIIKEGVIQRFEYTHELAWNVMKDFLTEVGNLKIFGSKDATREAFAAELIVEGDIWMDMIKSRNKSSHTYNEKIADDIFIRIVREYYPAFLSFRDKMKAVRISQQLNK